MQEMIFSVLSAVTQLSPVVVKQISPPGQQFQMVRERRRIAGFLKLAAISAR
jgi:hypothetical protein